MKKIIILAVLAALITSVCNAQLKVKSNGNVESGNILVNDSDSVYNNGNYSIFSNISNNQKPLAVSIYGRANGNTVPNSNLQMAIGVSGKSIYAPYAIGVKGEADAGNNNFGVYGYIPLTMSYPNLGAAIYGTVYSQPLALIDVYAGYFDGPVGITENLRVYGTIMAGHVYSRAINSTSNSEDIFDANRENQIPISEKLSSLDMISYYVESETKDNAIQQERVCTQIERNVKNKRHFAIPADQLEELFPDLVIDDEKGNKNINYIEMVPLLVQSIKELSAEVTTLKEQLGVQDPKKSVMKARSKQAEDADEVQLTIPDEAQKIHLNIYDLSGKTVRTTDVNESGNVRLSTYTKGLPTGTYAYSLIVDGKKLKTRKMIVKE